MAEYKSFSEYLKPLPENTVFRIWEYKKMFTPYEQDEKFSDQSVYEDEIAQRVIIDNVIELPDGDLLLAVHDWECDYGSSMYTDYYKLSNISIAKANSDMEENF